MAEMIGEGDGKGEREGKGAPNESRAKMRKDESEREEARRTKGSRDEQGQRLLLVHGRRPLKVREKPKPKREHSP